MTRARRVLTGALCINMIVGINYIWSIISKQLVAQYGWTSTQATIPYTLSLLMVALATIAGGMICDKGHPRACATTGAILFGGGLMLCGLSNSPLLMIIGFGLTQGIGNGLCASSTTATAMKWYPAGKRGMISGICMAGFAFSSVYMSVLLNYLLVRCGISRSFFYAGAVALVLLSLSAQLLEAAPQEKLSGEGEIIIPENDMDWRRMIRTSEFYKLWFILIFGMGGGLMIMGNIATIVSMQGGIENAAAFVVLIAVFNSIGRFTVGTVSDKIGIRRAFFLVLALQMANMLLFRFYHTTASLAFGTAIAGYAYGGVVAMNAPAAGRFSVRHLSQNAAVTNSAYGVGGLVMPLIAAAIVDRTGSYETAYLVAVGMLAAAICVNVLYREKNWVEEAERGRKDELREDQDIYHDCGMQHLL